MTGSEPGWAWSSCWSRSYGCRTGSPCPPYSRLAAPGRCRAWRRRPRRWPPPRQRWRPRCTSSLQRSRRSRPRQQRKRLRGWTSRGSRRQSSTGPRAGSSARHMIQSRCCTARTCRTRRSGTALAAEWSAVGWSEVGWSVGRWSLKESLGSLPCSVAGLRARNQGIYGSLPGSWRSCNHHVRGLRGNSQYLPTSHKAGGGPRSRDR